MSYRNFSQWSKRRGRDDGVSVYYPESKVEVSGFTAAHYDFLMNVISFGFYSSFIEKAVASMEIRPDDRIADFGSGTGRNACLMAEYLLSGGGVTGFDISDVMLGKFGKKCAGLANFEAVKQRIDKPFPSEKIFDKVFISFVLHGFPQEARLNVIRNAFAILKPGGKFFILDYGEYSLEDLPFLYRTAFRFIECPYAFDFIGRDWKKILSSEGFEDFSEKFFFSGFIRLLSAVKGQNGEVA